MIWAELDRTMCSLPQGMLSPGYDYYIIEENAQYYDRLSTKYKSLQMCSIQHCVLKAMLQYTPVLHMRTLPILLTVMKITHFHHTLTSIDKVHAPMNTYSVIFYQTKYQSLVFTSHPIRK